MMLKENNIFHRNGHHIKVFLAQTEVLHFHDKYLDIKM